MAGDGVPADGRPALTRLSVGAPSVAGMGRPHVSVYNEISVDGRIEGFAGDAEAYYRHGFTWDKDAMLMGSVTAQAFGPAETAEEAAGDGPDLPPVAAPPGFEELAARPRPLLVVVDSGGAVRNWRRSQAQPWYRGFVALVSRTTPSDHLDLLRRRGVEVVVAGDDRVDLAVALEVLHDEHGVERVRTDAGGHLTGALLAAGLVDELVLMVDPVVSGLPGALGVVELARPLAAAGVPLRLRDVERLEGDVLVLRYDVRAA